jgi:hypothetical protein
LTSLLNVKIDQQSGEIFPGIALVMEEQHLQCGRVCGHSFHQRANYSPTVRPRLATTGYTAAHYNGNLRCIRDTVAQESMNCKMDRHGNLDMSMQTSAPTSREQGLLLPTYSECSSRDLFISDDAERQELRYTRALEDIEKDNNKIRRTRKAKANANKGTPTRRRTFRTDVSEHPRNPYFQTGEPDETEYMQTTAGLGVGDEATQADVAAATTDVDKIGDTDIAIIMCEDGMWRYGKLVKRVKNSKALVFEIEPDGRTITFLPDWFKIRPGGTEIGFRWVKRMGTSNATAKNQVFNESVDRADTRPRAVQELERAQALDAKVHAQQQARLKLQKHLDAQMAGVLRKEEEERRRQPLSEEAVLSQALEEAEIALEQAREITEECAVHPEAQVAQPEAQVVKPEAQVVKPEAQVVKPEAQVEQPEAQVVKPEAQVEQQSLRGQYAQQEVREAVVEQQHQQHHQQRQQYQHHQQQQEQTQWQEQIELQPGQRRTQKEEHRPQEEKQQILQQHQEQQLGQEQQQLGQQQQQQQQQEEEEEQQLGQEQQELSQEQQGKAIRPHHSPEQKPCSAVHGPHLSAPSKALMMDFVRRENEDLRRRLQSEEEGEEMDIALQEMSQENLELRAALRELQEQRGGGGSSDRHAGRGYVPPAVLSRR